MKSNERSIRPGTISSQGLSESKQPGTDCPGWRPKRLGYGGRQWSHRPVTKLENKLRVESYRKLWLLESTAVDFGRGGKAPREYLTQNAFKLLKVLALGAKDMDALCWYAREDEFDLKAALDELREYQLLDESDPEMMGLV